MALVTHSFKHVYSRFKQGFWNDTLIADALANAQSKQRSCDWILYLDICQTIRGIQLDDLLEVVEQISSRALWSRKLVLRVFSLVHTPGLFPELNDSDRERLCSRLDFSACRKHASALLGSLQTGYLGTSLTHYPGLILKTNLFSLTNSVQTGRYAKASINANKLRSAVTSFDAILRQSCTTTSNSNVLHNAPEIAIVGNSPSILAHRQGAKIDAADIVIRFNKTALNGGIQRYTGGRTDVWIMSPSTHVDQCPSDARAIVVTGVNPFTRPSLFWRELPKLNRPLSDCPQSVWHSMVRSFQAPPSAGSLLIASVRDRLPEARLTCYGFTSQAKEFESRKNHFTDNKPRSTRHNWPAEAHWLCKQFTQSEGFVVSGQ